MVGLVFDTGIKNKAKKLLWKLFFYSYPSSCSCVLHCDFDLLASSLTPGTYASSEYSEVSPQGSILSPTLFTIKINSIIDALPDDIEKSLYADDLAVYCQSSNMAIIERRLHGCLDKLVTCADENGFKFTPTKTLCTFL